MKHYIKRHVPVVSVKQMEQIQSAQKPSLESVKREADECIARILARRDEVEVDSSCPKVSKKNL